MSKENSFSEWALVELFGHSPAFTRFSGPWAIYSITPVTEEVARGLCERYRNEPVSRFELPQIEEKSAAGRFAPEAN